MRLNYKTAQYLAFSPPLLAAFEAGDVEAFDVNMRAMIRVRDSVQADGVPLAHARRCAVCDCAEHVTATHWHNKTKRVCGRCAYTHSIFQQGAAEWTWPHLDEFSDVCNDESQLNSFVAWAREQSLIHKRKAGLRECPACEAQIKNLEAVFRTSDGRSVCSRCREVCRQMVCFVRGETVEEGKDPIDKETFARVAQSVVVASGPLSQTCRNMAEFRLFELSLSDVVAVVCGLKPRSAIDRMRRDFGGGRVFGFGETAECVWCGFRDFVRPGGRPFYPDPDNADSRRLICHNCAEPQRLCKCECCELLVSYQSNDVAQNQRLWRMLGCREVTAQHVRGETLLPASLADRKLARDAMYVVEIGSQCANVCHGCFEVRWSAQNDSRVAAPLKETLFEQMRLDKVAQTLASLCDEGAVASAAVLRSLFFQHNEGLGVSPGELKSLFHKAVPFEDDVADAKELRLSVVLLSGAQLKTWRANGVLAIVPSLLVNRMSRLAGSAQNELRFRPHPFAESLLYRPARPRNNGDAFAKAMRFAVPILHIEVESGEGNGGSSERRPQGCDVFDTATAADKMEQSVRVKLLSTQPESWLLADEASDETELREKLRNFLAHPKPLSLRIEECAETMIFVRTLP